MQPITTTKKLAEACARLAKYPFVTVDTEFQRETTYYPKLCIAQIASSDEAVIVDARNQVLGSARRPTPTEGGPADVAATPVADVPQSGSTRATPRCSR